MTCLDNMAEDGEAPSEADCCNSGCNPCVFDIYKNRNKHKVDNTTFRYDLLSQTKFKCFSVIEKNEVAHNVFFFTFQPDLKNGKLKDVCSKLEPIDIEGVLPYRAGQHLIMKLLQNRTQHYYDTKPQTGNSQICQQDCDSLESVNFITRAYTPVSLSASASNCCIDFIIKLYPNGVMSDYLKRLTIGEVVNFRGPYGDFEYVANKYKRILMLCVGTGIAPLYSIASLILNNEEDETIVKLFYGCRNINSILLRDQLRDMALFWNFSVDYYLSSDDSSTGKFGENFHFGRICENVIIKELENKQHKELFLICGTNKFNSDIVDILSKYCIDESNYFAF